MDIVLPDPYANRYLRDLKLLGKIVHGARNTYRDEQLNIIDAGEKVKKLIEDNISATGVDPKIPPINLLDPKFKEEVENSIGDQISLPSRLKKIMTKKKNTIEIESYDQLKDNLLRRVN